jgi:HTH-type transcriptional regulator, sugar sensing transcriptional regulator
MAMDQLTRALAELGFSPYEARAYAALVARSPANGYEVAKAAAVPTSKVYETLQRLQQRGAVRRFSARPVRYAATPPAELLATLRGRFAKAADRAEEALRSTPSSGNAELTWVVEGSENVLSTMQGVIDRAQRSLIAALWENELTELAPAFEGAGKRGVALELACYGAMPAGLTGYDLTLCGISAEERLAGKRLSAVVGDARESVTAVTQASGAAQGIWTENGVLGLIAREYIREEIMGRALINRLGEERYQALRVEDPALQAMLRAEDETARVRMERHRNAES